MSKFCTNCGQEVNNNESFCPNCGEKLNKRKKEIEIKNDIIYKDKIAAGILGIFLGAFGIHNFYLGYNGKGLAQLLMTLCSCFLLSFISFIWGFIEGILILTGNIDTDAQGNMIK